MRKGKALRLAGFVGAACASVALVATAVETTGAYFTSKQDGAITATGGHLTLTNTSTMALNFDALMPGATPTKQTVGYKVSVSSGNVDLWLTFDTNTPAYNYFTGGKYIPAGQQNAGQIDTATCWGGNPSADCGGLGRYANFAVANIPAGATSAATMFQSGNLSFADSSNKPNLGPASDTACHVDANGDGGSSARSTGQTLPYCGVPGAILVASNLADGATGTVQVSFGLGALAGNNDQGQSILPVSPLSYHLVATQHGQQP